MRTITLANGQTYATPLFLPVFERDNPYGLTGAMLQDDFGVRGIITNGFLIYKRRELREALAETTLDVKKLLGFEGLVMSDSGAYQALGGRVYVKNRKIVRFQRDMGADIASPFDLITPPRDNWKIANRKLNDTLKHVKEALEITGDRCLLAGVQQGGRYLDLRERAVHELVALGVKYMALGSLVPFFGRNHHIRFACRVIRQARAIVPPAMPLHLYGAGDPVELPFYVAMGCDVFDSSSFAHFARGGWYMTPYGAAKAPDQMVEYVCACPYCGTEGGSEAVWANERLRTLHNLWTVLDVVQRVRRLQREAALGDYLEDVLDRHMRWFPESQLGPSWAEVMNDG